jgi:hypothetical protein
LSDSCVGMSAQLDDSISSRGQVVATAKVAAIAPLEYPADYEVRRVPFPLFEWRVVFSAVA